MKYLFFLLISSIITACTTVHKLTEVDAATWGERFDDDFACLQTVKTGYEKDALTLESNKETLKHNRELWIKEVKRRDIISPNEWKLIASNKIAKGMSKCALYMSWGKPRSENVSVYGQKVRIQHVYGIGNYVYTKNGQVTSWQYSK